LPYQSPQHDKNCYSVNDVTRLKAVTYKHKLKLIAENSHNVEIITNCY